MIIVSNTSPLNYLILINETEILPRLFKRVVIPEAVLNELKHPGSPDPVKRWIDVLPTWSEIRKVSPVQLARTLGAGETEAISLAVQLNADLILLDDSKARKTAYDHRLKVAGVLNILCHRCCPRVDCPSRCDHPTSANEFSRIFLYNQVHT